MYDLRVVVEEVKGFCDLPMKPGDYFEVKGGRIIIPDGKYICMWALQSMMPLLPLKQRKIDEENDWVSYTQRICCPDPNGMVIYKIEAINKEINNTKESNDNVKSRMLVNSDVCTGCRACETVCSFHHTGSFCGENSRIKVKKLEQEGKDIPHVCRQCGNARCINACPVGALSKDNNTKGIILNEDICIGCRKCFDACPFGSITFNDNKPLICDLCGGDPKCIKRCAVNAISFENAGKTI